MGRPAPTKSRSAVLNAVAASSLLLFLTIGKIRSWSFPGTNQLPDYMTRLTAMIQGGGKWMFFFFMVVTIFRPKFLVKVVTLLVRSWRGTDSDNDQPTTALPLAEAYRSVFKVGKRD